MPVREFLRFKPLYKERIWGGRALESLLGRSLPGGNIGESWEMVDRPEAQSVVAGGAGAGLTLHDLLRREPAAIMGPSWPAGRRFPILVKWLDCRERLSLQVHPPAEVAGLMGGEPKTENWFIAATEPGAHLIVGLRRGVTREQFGQALAAGALEQCVHRFPVATGDSILVESGRVHAIDAGLLILEIQQNSDTTYRVFDWGRAGLDGKPRQLHVDQAMRSIRWDDFEPSAVRAAPTSAIIADCGHFRIRRSILDRGDKTAFAGGEQPRLVSVVNGEIRINGSPVRRGDNVLLPYAGDFEVLASEPSIILVTENFVAGEVLSEGR